MYNNASFQYQTSTSWPKGVYEVRIFDLGKREFIGAIFEIVAYKSKVEDIRSSGFVEDIKLLER